MSKETGYTIHKIDSKIDIGDIVFQENIPILFSTSLSETISKTSILLLEFSAKGLVYVIEHFDSLYINVSSNDANDYYTFLDWNNSLKL